MTLRISTVLFELSKYPDDFPVYFDYGAFPEAGVSSYRGSYDEAMISPADGGTAITNKELQDSIKKRIGTYMSGYKGGEYLIESETPLWVAEYGQWPGRAIRGVERNGNSLTIITELDEE